MERSSAAAILTCLVVVAATAVVPAVAGPAGTPVGQDPDSGRLASGPHTSTGSTLPPSPTDNTTARLVLPYTYVEQAQFETIHIGMASTLQSAATDVRLRNHRLAVEREFEAANSTEARRSLIDRSLIDLEARAAALEASERATIRNYSNGNITGQALLRRTARIHAAAGELQETLVLIRQLTDRIPVTVFDSRIRDIEGRLEPLRGPVRDRVARTLTGEASSTRIYVVATDDGLTLSTLVGGRYVREATLWTNRNASAPAELDFGEIGARVEELYPWVTSQDGATAIRWRGRGSWRFRASHSQGGMTAYVDAATEDVYRETQTFTVDTMPTTMTLVESGNDLRVTLERTYVGGPLRITVEDAATDAVVNARVSIDGHDLGHIGADGLVVTLEPRPSYTINVTTDETSLLIDVERPFEESGG